MRLFIIWLPVLLIVAGLQSAFGIQLGQTRKELVAESGPPTFENHVKNTAQYRWDLWTLDLKFQSEKISNITDTKTDNLTQGEITRLLDARSNGKSWTPMGFAGMKAKNWMRSDYATAVFDPKFPRSVRFSGGNFTPVAAVSAPPTPQNLLPTLQEPTLSPATISTPTPPHTTAPVLTADSPARSFALLVVTFISGCLIAGIISLYRKSKLTARNGTFLNPTRYPATPPTLPAGLPSSSESNREASHIEPTLDSITWEQFELLVGEIYRRQDWKPCLSSGLGSDGGIDLELLRGDEKMIVQCKHRTNGQIGVNFVRELYGVFSANPCTRALLVTNAIFTGDAQRFADGKAIELIDGPHLKRLIKSVTRSGENIFHIPSWLAEFTEGALLTNPRCPRCHGQMNFKAGPGWRMWGCRTFPRCRGKRDTRADFSFPEAIHT